MRPAISTMKWVFGLASVALLLLAARAVENAVHVRDVMANGAEVAAFVDGGVKVFGQRGGATYAVDLVWSDAGGGEHRARGLWINEALAKQLAASGGGEAPALMIRYLAGGAPVIVRQAAHDQEANRSNALIGMIGAAVSGLGFVVLAWAGRRRGA